MSDEQPTSFIYKPEIAMLLLSGAFNLPDFRMLAERLRCEHRQQHGGLSLTECEECGFLDAAVYQAQTGGRSLATDFFGEP